MNTSLIKSAHGEFFLDHHIASRSISLADQRYNPTTGAFDGGLWQIVDAGGGRVLIKSAHGEFFLDHHIASRSISLADQRYNPATGTLDGELWKIVDAGGGRVLIKSAHGEFFLDHHIASRSISLADQRYNPATGTLDGELWQIVDRVVSMVGPVISGFTPATGLPGTGVTITGSNFSTTTAVQFNGVTASFRIISDTTISAIVPANAGNGPITIVSPGGRGVSGSSFSVQSISLPANLAFLNTWIEPSSFLAPGQAFAVYFSFFNGGASPTGSFTIRIQLNNNAALLDITAQSYAPGASDSAYWIFPNGLPAGSHFFYAYLDVFNQVVEASKTDNVSYNGFTVR